LITNNCSSPTVPTPGQTTDNFLAAASYALLTALQVVLGIAVTYVAVRLFLRARVAYSKSKGQGELPDSLEDTVAVTGFNPATAGQIMAQAQGIADAAEGTESASDVADVLRTLASTDPAAEQAVADDLSTYFAGLADAATDTDVAACFQQLSDDFADPAAARGHRALRRRRPLRRAPRRTMAAQQGRAVLGLLRRLRVRHVEGPHLRYHLRG